MSVVPESHELLYGEFYIGHTNVMFIVPHGPDPHELGVADLVRSVASETGATAIINTRITRDLCDCNNIDEIRASREVMVNEFSRDVMGMLHYMRGPHVILVHFTPRHFNRRRRLFCRRPNGQLVAKRRGEARSWDIDIGCGLSEVAPGSSLIDQPRLIPAWTIKPHLAHTSVTCEPHVARLVQRQCERFQLRTCIGREWPAIARTNMTQYLANSGQAQSVFQLEIISDLQGSSRIRSALISVARAMVQTQQRAWV
jgi:hypothetical protein